jgi:lipopolysaccharide transport system ATP-binding protein
LSPFLELGVGFNPELTGRENLFLGGAILGLSRKEVAEKFDQIVSFAELEEFIDMKFKNYSSGMAVRLAFSLSINVQAEILLMDEVLAVGDTNFQSKCIDEFNKYKKAGKTVVLVTHDIQTVKRYCDRAILLKHGRIVSHGTASQVTKEYIDQNTLDEENRFSEDNNQGEKSPEDSKKLISIAKVSILDAHGKEKKMFKPDEKIIVRIFVNNIKNIEKAVFGIEFFTEQGWRLFGTHTQLNNRVINLKGVEYVDFVINKHCIRDGRIYLTPTIANESAMIIYDYQDKRSFFTIKNNSSFDEGIIELDYEWEVNEV